MLDLIIDRRRRHVNPARRKLGTTVAGVLSVAIAVVFVVAATSIAPAQQTEVSIEAAGYTQGGGSSSSTDGRVVVQDALPLQSVGHRVGDDHRLDEGFFFGTLRVPLTVALLLAGGFGLVLFRRRSTRSPDTEEPASHRVAR